MSSKQKALLLLVLAGLPGVAQGALTRIFTDEVKSVVADSNLKAPQSELLSATTIRIGQYVDSPGRIAASFPTADALLNIRALQTTLGSAATRTLGPVYGTVPPASVNSTISFSSGATTGGTVTTDGGAFTLPTVTAANFVRMALVAKTDGSIDTHFSAQQATQGALANAGSLADTLSGRPLGYVDLVKLTAAGFKTAGSAGTSPLIESGGLFLFGESADAGMLPSTRGGTGVNNGGTLTYGASNVTLTTGGTTSVTLPTSGTLATLAGTEVLTNKTMGSTNTLSGATATNFSNGGTVTLPSGARTLVARDTTDTLTAKTLSGNTATNLINGSGTFNFNSTGTITAPNGTDTLAGIALSQSITNKTLDSTDTLTGATASSFTNTGTVTLPTATTTLVGRGTTDALTNKDIDGGTASNTSRITLPKDTTTNINALTRKQGTLLYDTSINQVKYDTGSTLTSLATQTTATPTVAGVVTSYFPTVQSAVLSSSSGTINVTTTDGYEVVIGTLAGTQTVNLPAAASNTGRILQVKKTGATGTVTIDPNASETIDGSTTLVLATQYESVTITCDGSGWSITGNPFATATVGGGVSAASQNFFGNKTFVTASSFNSMDFDNTSSSGSTNVVVSAGDGSTSGLAYMTFIKNATGASTNWNIGLPVAGNDFFIKDAAGTRLKVDKTTTGVSFTGTNTNDSATAGIVGEVIELTFNSTHGKTTTKYFNAASSAITAGDWDISGGIVNTTGGCTALALVMSTSGASGGATDAIPADNSPPKNYCDSNFNTTECYVAPFRLSLSAGGTLYATSYAVFAGASCTYRIYAMARRRR